MKKFILLATPILMFGLSAPTIATASDDNQPNFRDSAKIGAGGFIDWLQDTQLPLPEIIDHQSGLPNSEKIGAGGFIDWLQETQPIRTRVGEQPDAS